MSEPIRMSWQACEHAGKKLQAEFVGTYARWEIVGDVRRRQDASAGPITVKHLAIPKAARCPEYADVAVWKRAAELLDKGPVEAWVYPGGTYRRPDPEARMIGLQVGPVLHEVYLATAANWATRLVQHTGPDGLWRMLVWRLEYSGSLKMRDGLACVINRSREPNTFEPLKVPDERDFFRLARTEFKSPAYRFARPPGQKDDTENWSRGMLPEWFPPGCRVYVDPRQGHLWDNSRPTKCSNPRRPVPGSWNAGPRRWR